MYELFILFTFISFIVSIICWIFIWIGIWKHRINGECPESRICKDSTCNKKTWCKKYLRYADQYEFIKETLRELEQKQKKTDL